MESSTKKNYPITDWDQKIGSAEPPYLRVKFLNFKYILRFEGGYKSVDTLLNSLMISFFLLIRFCIFYLLYSYSAGSREAAMQIIIQVIVRCQWKINRKFENWHSGICRKCWGNWKVRNCLEEIDKFDFFFFWKIANFEENFTKKSENNGHKNLDKIDEIATLRKSLT